MKNVTAAGVDMDLHGRTYHLTPLTDRQWHLLTLWIRADFLRSAEEAVREENPDRWTKIMGLAMERSKLISWTDGTSQALLRTPLGNARLFQLSCSTEIAIENAEKLFRTADDVKLDHDKLQEFYFLFCLINDVSIGQQEDESDDETEKRKITSEEIENARADRYRRLNESYGHLPTELAECTPAQLELMESQARHVTFNSAEEHDAYLRNVRERRNGQG